MLKCCVGVVLVLVAHIIFSLGSNNAFPTFDFDFCDIPGVLRQIPPIA